MLNWRWLAMGILGAALASGIHADTAHGAEKLNPRTLCPTGGSKGLALLLIDTTDPLTPVAQERLKELLKGFGDSGNAHYLEPGNELIVYRLTPRITDMERPVTRVCNPGNPEDRTLTDDLVGGRLDAKRRWRIFERQRLRALHQLSKRAPGERSPLLEGIALVTARHVPRLGVGKQRKPTRLMLFSDMLQNSDRLSHYKSLPEMKAFKALTGYAEMNSVLTGVDVWLFYLRRTGYEKIQTAEHYYWWTRVIELFGGRLIKQTPL